VRAGPGGFYDQNGNVTLQLINGVNKWRFTNLSNGKVLDINASGPGKLTLQPGNITHLEGAGVSFSTVTPGPGVPPDFPVFALTRGRIVADLDSFFNIVSLSALNGTVQDICAMLKWQRHAGRRPAVPLPATARAPLAGKLPKGAVGIARISGVSTAG
jgi:hypothetical protein